MIAVLFAAMMIGFAAPDEPVERLNPYEAYLSERKLDSVMVAHLRAELVNAQGLARVRLADRLGRLYVRQLSITLDSVTRQAIEERAHQLLKSVPDAEMWDLKLDLAKATYLKAEEIAERYRLRLASEGEKAEAQRVLAAVDPLFSTIATRTGGKVDQLEKKESSLRGQDLEDLKVELGDTRRLRSLAHYYAGWSAFYAAELAGNKQTANDAMVDFGYLLNAAPGKPPNVERLARPLLKYEHVARAALGCAMVASLRGKDTEAIRWIEMLESVDDLPAAIASQLGDRKLMILARADRWADVDVLVRRLRANSKPLSVPQARLVAVLTLDPSGEAARPATMEVRGKLSQLALGDLVVQGEVGHVLDLVQKFGADLIGEDGFVVRYVRALQAFEKAREAHKAAGGPEDPTTDPAAINRYREGIRLLDAVASSPDGNKFAKDSAASVMKSGLSSFYIGEFGAAAERFEKASVQLPGDVDQREALWFAVVALDRAVDTGNKTLAPERDRLALKFLERFPQSENAAKLLLRRAGVLSDEKSIAILLSIGKDTPLYLAARREASRLLFTSYRRALPNDREFAAARFLEVADETLDGDRLTLLEGKVPGAKEAGERLILRLRQMADVSLSTKTPDVNRAERTLSMLDEALKSPLVEAAKLVEEVAYRKVQLALAKGDFSQAIKEHDVLRAATGQYAIAAQRAIFKGSVERFKAAPEDVAIAAEVVQFGKRVLAQNDLARAEPTNVVYGSVSTAVAQAAEMLWKTKADVSMRALAIELDGKMLAAGVQTQQSLKRYAVLAESAAMGDQALEAWRSLLAALPAGSPNWFEARYESLRILMAKDRTLGMQVMDQHVALYPDYGLDPWGSKIKELAVSAMPGSPALPGSPGSPASKAPGAGAK